MVDGISVIMPTYNQAAFIRRAIFSLLQQTYLHWELVIVNDGSVDDTDRFVSSFLRKQPIIILLIFHQMITILETIWRF